MKFFKKIARCIRKWYNKRCYNAAKKGLRKACQYLEEYAQDVHGCLVKQDNFEEMKFLFLEAADNRINIKDIISTAIKAMITFIATYVFIIVNKEDLLLSFAETAASFTAIFFGVFYIPRKIKVWYYNKSLSTKNVEKLTYELYVKYRQ